MTAFSAGVGSKSFDGGERDSYDPESGTGGSLEIEELAPASMTGLELLYAGENDFAFVLRTQRGTPLSRHNAARSIRQAAEKAKLGRVTPHVLRRTTGTALSEARVPGPPRRRSWATRSSLPRHVRAGPL